MKKLLLSLAIFCLAFPDSATKEFMYAPWRSAYNKKASTTTTCPFCRDLQKQKEDKKNLILLRAKTCAIFLNLFPYTKGHLMVIPYRHVRSLSQLSQEERAELLDLAAGCTQILEQEYGFKDFNAGFNIGRPAGASVCEHIHMHIVPRWVGDFGFQDILFDTRVISCDLDEFYAKLLPHFQKMFPEYY